MTKIYLARHGESIANTQGIYQGQTYDTDLSLLGQKQAGVLAKFLVKNTEIKKIMASPLKRTKTTAEIVAKELKLTVEENDQIIETNHGLWEGQDKDWIRDNYPQMLKSWAQKPISVNFPEGERYTQTIDRVDKFFLLNDWREDTLLVTHDNIVRIIICLVKGVAINKM